MMLTDDQLATTCKVMSIRRQNLYTSLQMYDHDSERWRFFDAQITEVTDALNALEAERDRRRLAA